MAETQSMSRLMDHDTFDIELARAATGFTRRRPAVSVIGDDICIEYSNCAVAAILIKSRESRSQAVAVAGMFGVVEIQHRNAITQSPAAD